MNNRLDNVINQFLISINKKLDGIIVLEDQDVPRESFLKFRLEITSSDINKNCFWSPSSFGISKIENEVEKFFNVYQEIGWNNTRTVCWFTTKKQNYIQNMEKEND